MEKGKKKPGIRKPSHTGRRPCPPGQMRVNGRCVKDRNKNGIKRLEPAPSSAVLIPWNVGGLLTRKGRILINGGTAHPIVSEKAALAPLYIIRFSKEKTQVMGVGFARNLNDIRKTRITMTRTWNKPRNVTIKSWGGETTIRARFIVWHEPQKKLSPDPIPEIVESLGLIPVTEEEQPTEKILAENVGNPTSNGGIHGHILVRSEARTWNDGRHFHLVMDPEMGLLVTDIDGEHPHGIEGERTGKATSIHRHVVGRPDGEFVFTDVSGEHDHDVLVDRTSNSGVHFHKVNIGGRELQTLTVEEEAMLHGPGPMDGPDEEDAPGADAASVDMESQLSEHLDTLDKGFEKAWEESEWILTAKDIEKQTTVQSVVLSKQRFSDLGAAKAWVQNHGFKATKVDEQPNIWRFRQFPPVQCQRGTFRNRRVTRGVMAVICVRRGDRVPPTLRRMANERAQEIQKRIIESSTVRVQNVPTGFGFKIRGSKLFAFMDVPKGKPGEKVIILEVQRLDGPGMKGAPSGAVDGMEIEMASGDPRKLAKERLGHRVFVLRKVAGSDLLLEDSAFLAVIDPTKELPKEDCDCHKND